MPRLSAHAERTWGWGWARRSFEVIVKRAACPTISPADDTLFFFLFCLSINELYSCLSDLDDTPRRLVIYDFRASTCILRPRKRERMSMHLRMHQALVIGRAFVRYHPNPLRLRLFVSASSFHFFFLFFSFFFCICVNRSKEFDLGEVVKLATFDVIYFFCLSLSSWNLLLEHSSKRSKVKLESQMFEIYVDFFLVLREK